MKEDAVLLQDLALGVENSETAMTTALHFGNLEAARSTETVEARSKRLHQESVARFFTALKNNNPLAWSRLLKHLFGHNAVDSKGHLLPRSHKKHHRHHEASIIVPTQPRVVEDSTHLAADLLNTALSNYLADVSIANQKANTKAKAIVHESWNNALPEKLSDLIVDVPSSAETHDAMIEAAIDDHEFDTQQIDTLLGTNHAKVGSTTPSYDDSLSHTATREETARHHARAQVASLTTVLVDSVRNKIKPHPEAPKREEAPQYHAHVEAGINRHARAFATVAVLQGMNSVTRPLPGAKPAAPNLQQVFLRMLLEARLEELHHVAQAESRLREAFNDMSTTLADRYASPEDMQASAAAMNSILNGCTIKNDVPQLRQFIGKGF